jgi:low temperature requirement protein LtrA
VSDTRPDAVEQERGISPVELLWDLVFVFAITQVTTRLGRELSWAGLVRSMLVLALVWWAWSAFVWVANAQDASSPALRRALLLATVFIFITGLAVPHAFTSEGPLFWEFGLFAGPAIGGYLLARSPTALWAGAALACLIAGAIALREEPRLRRPGSPTQRG